VQYEPQGATARVVLGRALVMAGRHAEAVQELQRAIEIGGDDARARYWMGLALLETRDYQRATEMLFDSMELYREQHKVASVDHLISLGLSLAREGRYRESVDQFVNALGLDCRVAAAYENIATVLRDAKDTSLEHNTWTKVARTCGSIGWGKPRA
jgi:tetratricopeptide (TPR) repeat protein